MNKKLNAIFARLFASPLLWRIASSLLVVGLAFPVLRYLVGPLLATPWGALFGALALAVIVWLTVRVYELRRALALAERAVRQVVVHPGEMKIDRFPG